MEKKEADEQQAEDKVEPSNPGGTVREEKKRTRKKGKQLLPDWEIEKKKGEEVVEAVFKEEVNEKEVQRALEEALKDMPQARAGTAAKFGHTSAKDKFFGYNANLIMDHKEEIITAIKLDGGDERGNEHFEENYEKQQVRIKAKVL